MFEEFHESAHFFEHVSKCEKICALYTILLGTLKFEVECLYGTHYLYY